MRKLFQRAPAIPEALLERAGLDRRERVLAHGQTSDGSWLIGTRRALVLLHDDGPHRVPWERIRSVGWDNDASRLLLTELVEFGEPQPRHEFTLKDEGLLLQLIRERVQASIVVQRRIELDARHGFTVLGRRGSTAGEVSWLVEYDEGVDPAAPAVVAAVDAAVASARNDAGE